MLLLWSCLICCVNSASPDEDFIQPGLYEGSELSRAITSRSFNISNVDQSDFREALSTEVARYGESKVYVDEADLFRVISPIVSNWKVDTPRLSLDRYQIDQRMLIRGWLIARSLSIDTCFGIIMDDVRLAEHFTTDITLKRIIHEARLFYFQLPKEFRPFQLPVRGVRALPSLYSTKLMIKRWKNEDYLVDREIALPPLLGFEPMIVTPSKIFIDSLDYPVGPRLFKFFTQAYQTELRRYQNVPTSNGPIDLPIFIDPKQCYSILIECLAYIAFRPTVFKDTWTVSAYIRWHVSVIVPDCIMLVNINAAGTGIVLTADLDRIAIFVGDAETQQSIRDALGTPSAFAQIKKLKTDRLDAYEYTQRIFQSTPAQVEPGEVISANTLRWSPQFVQ